LGKLIATPHVALTCGGKIDKPHTLRPTQILGTSLDILIIYKIDFHIWLEVLK